MDSITLKPISAVKGEVTLPGSKSLSNRALLLSAVGSGDTRLTNLLKSDDTSRMVDALRQLQINVELSPDWAECRVQGNGGLFETPANSRFNLGNAGTAIRPLTSMLALVPGSFEVDGDKYMRERPINHLGDALTALGATIQYMDKPGYPPLRIEGGKILGGPVSIDGSISSQFLTSLLMSLPLARNDSQIEVVGDQVSKPYLDITLHMMSLFGVQATHLDYKTFNIPGGQRYSSPGTYMIEGDASSASYFFGAGAISGKVRVNGIGKNSIQGDLAFIDVIEKMGARVSRSDQWIEVESAPLKGIDIDLNHIPDAAMTLASVALFARGRTTIRNIYNWRVKETDRMHAMASELRKLGAVIETGSDYIVIDPPNKILPATIETYGDHRVAMALSLAALGNEAICILDPDCTRKTFPGYFEVLNSIAEH